ncbi:MAG: acyl-CoA dehydrogenase family protein [Alicyclobacillus herbarius]|uniref:acyl-CoA dehydrogenase family protein n=1 Tax=Alicyclobacillus herbarius TaxID=122960 RepID=UPI002352D401|nr:acyl-CoA dehydrogenase family protein [Alicyclobacillus herbarius]MCL6632644.1 acyl-CoA dehydrogenase family protein [Alicyclobacillus herbarius]
MDFSLSEEQRLFQSTIRRFAQTEIAPFYTTWERRDEFPQRLWRRMSQMGLTSLRVDEAYGGVEADAVTTGLAVEAIAYCDFNCAYAVVLSALIGEILNRHAAPRLKEQWLPGLCDGSIRMCIALTEPEAGSDAAAVRTQAVVDGEDFILDGEKASVSLAMHANAALVFVRTLPNARARGISALVVPLDTPGIQRRRYDDMGNRPVGRGSLVFESVRVPRGNLVGTLHTGFQQVMNGFDLSRLLIALQCLAAAQASLDETRDYVLQRKAFGRVLSSFQGVSFPFVEQQSYVEMARLACYHGLWLKDQGRPHTKEAAMMKWLGPSIAREAIHTALILHGHTGYSRDLPLEQRLRDVIGLEIGDGTPQIQKLVLARAWFGRDRGPH